MSSFLTDFNNLSRQQLELAAHKVGYLPNREDTDADLILVLTVAQHKITQTSSEEGSGVKNL